MLTSKPDCPYIVRNDAYTQSAESTTHSSHCNVCLCTFCGVVLIFVNTDPLSMPLFVSLLARISLLGAMNIFQCNLKSGSIFFVPNRLCHLATLTGPCAGLVCHRLSLRTTTTFTQARSISNLAPIWMTTAQSHDRGRQLHQVQRRILTSAHVRLALPTGGCHCRQGW